MTASEASRNFSHVLDSAERGDAIVITRGGRRVAARARFDQLPDLTARVVGG